MKKIIAVLLLMGSIQLAHAQVKTGQAAPEFRLKDAEDKPVSLSSLKGKVVLIDFWASWCGPCRESIPGVIKLYNKFHAAGFEVLGVSLDDNKAKWLKAVKKFHINYLQVNDPGGWQSAVAALYGVDAIPATFLLDKSGKIVAIDEEDLKALESKIKKLL